MTNECEILKEIHRIREEIYEEIKDMTPAESAKHAKDIANKLIKEYNLKVEYKKSDD